MTGQAIEQLRAELAQRNLEHINDMKVMSRQGEKLIQIRAELAIIDEALREFSRPDTEDRGVYLMRAALDDSEADFAMTAQSLAQARDELAQLRKQASVQAQRCGYCGYRYSAGTNGANFAVLAEHIKSCPRHPLAKALAELAQARAELAAVDGAAVSELRLCLQDTEADFAMTAQSLAQARDELKGMQATDHQFGRQAIRRNRDYWYDKAVAAECERDEWRKKAQTQSDEVQEHWLGPVEAEGLRRQLKHAEDVYNYRIKEYDALEIDLCHAAESEAAIVEAAEAYLAQRKHRHLVMDEDCKNLQDVLGHRSEAAAKLLGRLAEAEQQREWLSKERNKTIARLHQVAKKVAEKDAALATERQLRREAEQGLALQLNAYRTERSGRREAEQGLRNGHGALDRCQVNSVYEDGKAMTISTRILWLNQRAERAEAELASQQDARILHFMLANISEILDEYGIGHYCSKDRDSEGMNT